ncbi:MAG: peptidoglycan editing factor PgeF [Alphaproteobacteria bacterium]|nr:peptidoglycan editing factor PgeF [Alphaproteobacteria bacterium]
MIEPLHADNLATLPRIRHAFFTRVWGNGGFSGQETEQGAAQNRGRMAAQLGVEPDHLLSAYQIHSPDIVTVTEIWEPAARPEADGLVTNIPGIALAVLTADCVPVLFADAKAGVIGAAHAGWRGAIGGVIENTLAAMEKLGARRGSIETAIGPCIWQSSYEVSDDFMAPFLAEKPENEKFFRPAFRSGHAMFDLPGYVEAKLRALGVASVESSPGDTCANPANFYSHRYSTLRGEKRDGNLLSAIALVS